jgi:ribosome-associated protein
MPRKERPEPEVEATPEPTGRPIRSEHREAMMDLKDLANRIAKLPQAARRALPLDEELQEQLDRLANADPRSDRRRLLMRAKLLLGAVDLARLNAALAGDTATAAWERESVRWRTRILAGDDALIQEFVEAFPGADRQAIRTATREARGQGPVATRAHIRLLQLIRAAATAQGE